MHATPLDHDVSCTRDRLIRLAVRPLAIDDIKGRRRRDDGYFAAEDDHVVCRGRAVLGIDLSVSSNFFFVGCVLGIHIPWGSQSAAQGPNNKCSRRPARRCPSPGRHLTEAGRCEM